MNFGPSLEIFTDIRKFRAIIECFMKMIGGEHFRTTFENLLKMVGNLSKLDISAAVNGITV